MSEELNNLVFDNTKVTFDPQPNNAATSDELEAALMYQDKMGTNYSKSKMAVRAFNFVGVSLILTAAAIKTGNIVSNVFAPAAPSVTDVSYNITESTFTADFTVVNKGQKKDVYYSFIVNEIEVLKEDCSKEQTYHVEYPNLQIDDECGFYINYGDTVIETKEFKVEV